MAPSTPSPATAPATRVPLRSIERSMTLSDDHWFMVAHVMLVRGATDELARHAPAALLQTFNKHPRTRLRLLKDDAMTGEIRAPFASVDELTRHGLLHVKQVHEGDALRDTASFRAFVERHGQLPYDRYTQFAFQLHLWVDAATDRARVILFADHAYSDGNSGTTIINDFLTFAAQLSRGAAATPEPPLPLSASLYEALMQGHALAAPALRLIMQYGVRTLLRVSPAFRSLLPPNDAQKDFRLVQPPKNPSFLLFADGTPENLDKIVAACRVQRTTFFGAFSSAILLSFIVLTDALDDAAFKLTLAVNFNMRDRVAQPIAKDAVGCFITASEMPTPTINVPQQLFWDLARTLKATSVENSASFPAIALPLIMMDQHFQRGGDATLPTQFPLPGSTLADADVSSLGKYPHARKHSFAGARELEIETLHYSGHVPFLGAASYFYAASMDQVGYSLSHHFEEATGRALFDTAVAIMEASWRIGDRDTLVDVATKLLPRKGREEHPVAAMA